MKVESKHGTKIPKYAVGAALLAAATLISGCDGDWKKEPRNDSDDDNDDYVVEYMGDTTVCEDYWDDDNDTDTSTDTEIESSVETTFGWSTVDGVVSNAYGLKSEQYNLFMKKIDEVEASEPGAYKYAIGASKDRKTETYSFVLMTVKGVYTTCYAVVDGELVKLDSTPGELKVSTQGALSYEDIKRLPCLVDTWYLLHNEVTETGISENLYTPIVDSIEDGEYYGEIIGISEDGTRLLLKLGKPVILDYEYIDKEVAPFAEIGFKDFIKTVDKVEAEDKGLGIVITSPTYDYGMDFAVYRYHSIRGYTNKGYIYYDYTYWADDYVIIELPLADDCKVFNYGEYYNRNKEIGPDWDENGDSMTGTLYYKKIVNANGTYPYDSGWITIPPLLRVKYRSEAEVESIIISDGQVKEIEMSASAY